MTSGRAGRTAIKRPGAGIDIDRVQLIRMRQVKLMSRAQLAEAMSNGDFSITPDAIAKIENGYRRPKTATLARMCMALGCDAVALLPSDSPVPPLLAEAMSDLQSSPDDPVLTPAPD
jgi:transcriptional regulator with XRE-family HTH domain